MTIQLENASELSTINKKLLRKNENLFKNGVENPEKTFTICFMRVHRTSYVARELIQG